MYVCMCIYIFVSTPPPLDSEEGLELRKSILKTERRLRSNPGDCFIQGCSVAFSAFHSVPHGIHTGIQVSRGHHRQVRYFRDTG